MVFTERMLEVQRELEAQGHQAFVSRFAAGYVGKCDAEKERLTIYDKNNNDAIREFWDVINESDAILVLNYTRRGIENYIGGNAFLEMGFAHVLHKQIYLVNPIPQVDLYRTEIEAMRPIIIGEDWSKLG